MTITRTQTALEDLIKAASQALGGNKTGLFDAVVAARKVALHPLVVKPLSWREIDPERAYVAYGYGFSGQVNRLHTGKWEAVWQGGRLDFADQATARAQLEAIYAAAILSCLI